MKKLFLLLVIVFLAQFTQAKTYHLFTWYDENGNPTLMEETENELIPFGSTKVETGDEVEFLCSEGIIRSYTVQLVFTSNPGEHHGGNVYRGDYNEENFAWTATSNEAVWWDVEGCYTLELTSNVSEGEPGMDDYRNTVVITATPVPFDDTNSYDLLLNAKPGGTVTGAGTYLYGSLVEISAQPEDGYIFEKWSDDNTRNPRKIAVKDDMELSAIFKKEFAYNFKESQADWTINNVIMPEGLSYVWNQTSNYGMKANAYVNNFNNETESWLISPTLNLSGSERTTISFSHARRYGANNQLSVQVSSDNGATWHVLSFPNWPSGNDWNFINSGTVEITQYSTEQTKIAFVYTSSTLASATWEISDVHINFYPKEEVLESDIVQITNENNITRKVIIDGRLYILKDGKKYTVTGVCL